MNKHTPGPWLSRGKSDSVHESSDTHPYGCQIFRFAEDQGPSDDDLNLILSAPDLLEALERVEQETMLLARMKNCELRRGKGSFGIAVMGDELALEWQEYNKIRRALEDKRFAAIAKARGEA